ncbi:MAG: aromatic amino acid ammonia-lyase [Planctomycetota bacterium]|nr:aromatic amino acid ammonia-lyase [Planctomycetota bacterium]
MSIKIDGESLDIEEVCAVGRGADVEITNDGWQRIVASYSKLVSLIEGGTQVYGVTTGVGKFVSVKIPRSEMGQFQLNLLRSHAVALGEPLSRETVRAAMALRLNCFAKGASAVSPDAVKILLSFLKRDITPVVRSRGSLGASGDLALLAQMALPLVGEGMVIYKGKEIPAEEALRKERIVPLKMGPKDALSFINGTSMFTAESAFAISEMKRLFEGVVNITAFMFFLCASPLVPLDERFSLLRPHKGQAEVARRLRLLLEDSPRCKESRKIQDVYSLRCAPQVLGAVLDTLSLAESALNTEISSVSDNPLVFNGEVLSGGNFHGEPLALPLDYAAISVVQLASLCERHIARLMNPDVTGLSAFLSRKPGIESGLMLAHYVAVSLLNEVRLLSTPATVDRAVVSLETEDNASFGMMCALKLRRSVQLSAKIAGLALLCLVEALDMAEIVRSLPRRLFEEYRKIRLLAPPLKTDSSYSDSVEKIASLILRGEEARE